jgi:hypothetical protein
LKIKSHSLPAAFVRIHVWITCVESDGTPCTKHRCRHASSILNVSMRGKSYMLLSSDLQLVPCCEATASKQGLYWLLRRHTALIPCHRWRGHVWTCPPWTSARSLCAGARSVSTFGELIILILYPCVLEPGWWIPVLHGPM